MVTIVHVYDKGTQAPIEGATVTCTQQAPKTTDASGNVAFSLRALTTYGLRADADGYVISEQKQIQGWLPTWSFGLEKEEEITIAVKRPTWVSMTVMPAKAEYPIGGKIQVSGYIRVETEPYTEGEVWLVDTDASEIITEKLSMAHFGAGSYYELEWTPSEYKTGGYNITVGCDAFVSGSNQLGAWNLMPNGFSKHLNVVWAGMASMRIHPHTLNRELFESNEDTVIACDDPKKACTMFKFQIWNDSSITARAWYKVSFVGGATLYEDTTPALGRWGYSERIEDYVCALYGSLPVGAYTILVEVGSEGYPTPTATLTDELHVISATTLRVTTYDAINISEDTATLKGSVTNTNGQETDIGFEYGETTSYGSTVWADMTTTPCDFYKDISGLEEHTLYHFRAIAETAAKSVQGNDMTFWTQEGVHGIYFSIKLPNESLLDSNEVLACEDHELACTNFNFQIKNERGSSADARYTVSTVDGSTLYGDTINIRAYGTSPTISNTICALRGGLPVGEHEVLVEVGKVDDWPLFNVTESEWLTVLEYGTPTVDTTGVEDPTLESATLVGTLKDVGMATEVGFEYGLLYGSTKAEWLRDPITGGTYKLAIYGLEGHNVYRYRAVARAHGKTSYGDELSFEATPALINTISLGWNLEDAKMDEYNVHFRVTHLSEAKRYRIVVYGDKGYEYARKDPVTATKEAEIKVNIPLDLIEGNGYGLSCGVYDLDKREYITTKATVIPPFDLKLTTNIGGTITDIPTTIRTDTDYPFTIQIDNTGDKDRKAAVIFQFIGASMGPLYIYPFPHVPPSEVTEGVVIPAGESIGFEIIINLPNEAVPTGALSATYDLYITLSAFEYEAE